MCKYAVSPSYRHHIPDQTASDRLSRLSKADTHQQVAAQRELSSRGLSNVAARVFVRDSYRHGPLLLSNLDVTLHICAQRTSVNVDLRTLSTRNRQGDGGPGPLLQDLLSFLARFLRNGLCFTHEERVWADIKLVSIIVYATDCVIRR